MDAQCHQTGRPGKVSWKDEYAFLRDAYLERRKYEVNDGLSEEDLSQDEDFEDF